MRDYAGTLPVNLELDLFAAGWDGSLEPYPGMSLKTFAMQSIRKSLVKKLADDTGEAADSKALGLFLEINEKCRGYSFPKTFSSDLEAVAVGEMQDFIHRFFYDGEDNFLLSQCAIEDGFGFGNGANIGSFGTDFLSKVGTSLMSATHSGLHELFLQAIGSRSVWSDVESIRSKARGYQIVPGSRLSFVPKTTEISRTICTEPLLNMLYQKGVAKCLEGRLNQICGIDLTRQPAKNQQLARIGSLTGEFGTIDLSSASDSMSLALVKACFPRRVYDLLCYTRSPLAILPDGSKVDLHMISSMGNAFTFPLQTLFFSAVVYGAYRAYGIPIARPFRHSLGNFAVFGDDIIVVAKAYDLVTRILSLCGFSVNIDKSFNTGLFRESCGHDYYYGENVRGVYIKSLRTSQDRYSAINRLNHWSARWGIPLPEVVQSLLRGLQFTCIPFDEMDTAGIKVPCSAYVARKKVRRNPDTGGLYYQCWVPRPRSYDVTSVESRPPKIRGWIDNPSAVLLAALAGTLREGKLVIRDNRPVYLRKRRSSSRWDYIFAERGHIDHAFSERWKSFAELNLNLY